MSANVLGAILEPDIHTLVYITELAELKHVIALTKATWYADERGTTLSLEHTHIHTHTHTHTHTTVHTPRYTTEMACTTEKDMR